MEYERRVAKQHKRGGDMNENHAFGQIPRALTRCSERVVYVQG